VPEKELRALFAEAKLVTVWPQGIKRHGLIYSHPSLGEHIGEQVWARQGRMDTELNVYDQEGHFICAARNPLAERGQLTDEARREFTANRRVLAKSLTAQADERISRARNKEDWLLERGKRRIAEQGGHPPRPGIRQITPFTGQMPAVASAQPSKMLRRYRYQS
jgi:hypothetical protein